MNKKIDHLISKNKTVKKIIHSKRHRIVFTAAASLALNICYAVYNGILGIVYSTLWFLVLCVYYIILSVMRFAAVSCERKNRLKNETVSELFVLKFSGIMLMILSLVLAGSVYYSTFNETAKEYDEIVMISIAAFTFYKVVLAIINAIKIAKHNSPLLTTIRNISCADAAASILSLQRSMLVSFEGMSASEIEIMNIATGIAVCLFIFILGLLMTIGILGVKRHHDFN
ncbi:MAG: hypothetical protein ACI4W6_07015 [Acutalibacteraceae bacterium]